MTTARCLTDLADVRRSDGRRELLSDLVVDLGVHLPELHEWAKDRRLDEQIGTDYRVKLSGNWTTIVRVPAGFDTDYSSVPGPAWWVGRWDQTDIAGVTHDALVRWLCPEAVAAFVWRLVARSGERHVNAAQGFLGWAGLRVWGKVVYEPSLRRKPH